MRRSRLLWSAPAWRANLEGWLAALLMLAGLGFTARFLTDAPFFEAVVLVGACIPSLIGLRRRPLSGSTAQIFLLEILQAGLITAGLTLLENILFSLFGATQGFIRLHQMPDLIVFSVSAAVYLFWRAFRWAWVRWDALRRKHFAWSLTHALLVLISGLVFAVVLVVLLLLGGFSPLQVVASDAPPVLFYLAKLTTYLFYVMLAAPFAIIPVLLVLLPPWAGAAYWVSRRLTRRLERLAVASSRLSQGDWSARVAPEGEDELARVQASFNTMAEELEKANRALIAQRDRVAGLLHAQRELTASVSHELRTPVTTALAYLENDLDHLEDLSKEALQRDLEITRHEVERLQHLIDDLFTLSKAEVSQLSLEMATLPLEPLIRQTLDASARLAWDNRRVQVQAELPANLPMVWADAGRVEQVLRNLLANGVRHTPPGGFVVVGAEGLPGAVRVTVTDTGEGIDPQDLPHVWERFFRGAGSAGDGRTGLGLAIVKELVESMGGTVAVSSEPDQGSTFSFVLNTCDEAHS